MTETEDSAYTVLLELPNQESADNCEQAGDSETDAGNEDGKHGFTPLQGRNDLQPPSPLEKLWDYARATWRQESDNYKIVKAIYDGHSYSMALEFLIPLEKDRSLKTNRFGNIKNRLNEKIRERLNVEIYREGEVVGVRKLPDD